MENKLELTDNEIKEISDGIVEVTIPSEVMPPREWIAKHLQELALKIRIDLEIVGLEIKWSVDTDQCTLIIQLRRDK